MESNELVLSNETSDETVQRTFRQIETWDELVERWGLVETEPEAVGMLYWKVPLSSDKNSKILLV
jgi:hypothetical protein